MNTHYSRFNKLILVLILLFAVAILVCLFSGIGKRHLSLVRRDSGPPYFVEGMIAAAEADPLDSEIGTSRRNAIVKAVEKVGPSVVSISTIQVEMVRDPWFDLFYPFGRGMERKNYGLGSGFIIDERGYILTNQHVIENADEIKVTLSSGKEYEANIMGADYESDMAVLRISSGSDLPVAELGDSSDLMMGEWAIAIGNPFGFLIKDSAPSISLGVISATGRSIQQDGRVFDELIQTDATINPGNSGGPLVNCYGQVIGVNTAIFSTSGGSQGVGFAMPINASKRVINELIQHGMVVEPWLGIEYQALSSDIVEHLGSPVDKGVLISNIAQDSPAQKAGFMSGDIVVQIGDTPVESLDDATATGKKLSSGQEVIFRIVRNGELQNIPVKVGFVEASDVAKAWFGLVVQKPTAETARRYGLSSYKKGVLVIQVDKNSAGDRAELQRGDLILSMAREKGGLSRNSGRIEEAEINTMDDFRKFISGVRKGQRIRIIFQRKNDLWRTYLTAEKE